MTFNTLSDVMALTFTLPFNAQELAVAASACGYNVDELDALFSNADTVSATCSSLPAGRLGDQHP